MPSGLLVGKLAEFRKDEILIAFSLALMRKWGSGFRRVEEIVVRFGLAKRIVP
jgi:hypothetical protein